MEARSVLDGDQQRNPGEAHGALQPAEAVSAHYEIVHDVLHAVCMWDVVPHNVLHLRESRMFWMKQASKELYSSCVHASSA